MKKKLLAITLCLVFLMAPLATIGVFADTDAATGYTVDENTKTYTVSTADGLLAVAALVNGGMNDYNITLAADIDLTGKTWTPIGTAASIYSGTFDGGNFTIKGLTFTQEQELPAALIGEADGGCTVRNLKIVEANITGVKQAAPVISHTKKDAASVVTVENVHIRNSNIVAKNKYGYAAGIIAEVGSANTVVNNCSVVATITSAGRASGVVGGESASSKTDGSCIITIKNTIVAGTITSNSESTSDAHKYGASGLMGNHSTLTVTLENCAVIADLILGVENSPATVGSLILNINKLAPLTITNCVGNGAIVGDVLGFQANVTNTIANTSIYSEGSTDANMSIYTNACAKDGTFKIDTVDTDAKEAKLAVIATKDALKTKVKAIFNGNTIITEEMIEDIMHEHSYGNNEAAAFVKEAATCTNPAVYYKSCSCGAVDTAQTFVGTSALGHSPSDKWTNDANQHWHVCTECLEEKSDVADHTFGDWTVTKEATEKREGEKAKACTVCGYEITEKIEKVTPETAPADSDNNTTDTDANTGDTGCGSTVLGIGTVVLVSLGAGALCLKKKKD